MLLIKEYSIPLPITENRLIDLQSEIIIVSVRTCRRTMRHRDCDLCQCKSMNVLPKVSLGNIRIAAYRNGNADRCFSSSSSFSHMQPHIHNKDSKTTRSNLRFTTDSLCIFEPNTSWNSKDSHIFLMESKRSIDSCRDFKSIKACNRDDSQTLVFSHSTNAEVYTLYYYLSSLSGFFPKSCNIIPHNQYKTATPPPTQLLQISG